MSPATAIAAAEASLDHLLAAARARAARGRTTPHAVGWGAVFVGLPLGMAALGGVWAERPWAPAVAAVGTVLAYVVVYLPLKRACVPGAKRQLLLDLVVFCVPAYLGSGLLLGESLRTLTDLLAVVGPACVVPLRASCAVEGCCQGRAARHGVRYPGSTTRVVPLPLFEVVFAGLLAGCTLAFAALAPGRPLLPPVAAAYGVYRFGSEVFRGPSVPRRVLGLTVSQALAGVLAAGAVVWGWAW